MRSYLRGISGAGGLLGLLLLAAPAAALPPLPTYAPPVQILRLPNVGGAEPNEESPGVILGVADFNCDGLLDVVIARGSSTQPVDLTILLNDGHGGFFDGTSLIFIGPPPRTQFPARIIIADFNGDGRPDIFVPDSGAPLPNLPGNHPFPGYQAVLALSTPGCRLVDATANLPPGVTFTPSAAAADIDGDGSIDLYLGGLGPPGSATGPQIWLNDGTGHFTQMLDRLAVDFLANASEAFYTASHFVDVNGDGFPDLVLGSAPNGGPDRPAPVLLNDGTGHFTTQFFMLKPFADAVALDIKSTDLNGDGFPDLLVLFTAQNGAGRWVQVLVNNGDGTFRDETASRLPQGDPSQVGVCGTSCFGAQDPAFRLDTADFDGDGRLDFGLVMNRDGAEKLMYLDDGAGNFTPVTFAADRGLKWVPLSVNGDGRRDIVTEGNSRAVNFLRDIGPILPPGIPQDVRATLGQLPDRVRVTWQPAWGAASYEVWRATSPSGTPVRLGSTPLLSFDDFSAVVGIAYDYSVRGMNSTGMSAASPSAAGAAGAPAIELTPADGLHFGLVPLGGSTDQIVTIKNIGNVTLRGSVFGTGPFSVVFGGALRVAPGAIQLVTVRFSPTSESDAGDVVMASNGGHVSIPSSEPGILSITKTGSGRVTSVPGGIDCGPACASTFTPGASVTLTATPAAGFAFAGWSGCDSVSGTSCVVALTGNRTVGATFAIPNLTLTLAKAGTGTGTVTSSPAGISCGATCTALFPLGVVTLTASADPAFAFAGWSGGGCTGTGPCVVTLSADTTVSAQFNPGPDSVHGNIIVIKADPTVLKPGKVFDLQGKTLTFTPRIGDPLVPLTFGYDVDVGALAFDARLGNNTGVVHTNDVATIDFLSLWPVNFPFYGQPRSRVYINPYGNITFNAPESTYFNPAGSLFNVLDQISAYAHVAPLWSTEYNPAAGGGVFANLLADRLIVTWNRVIPFGSAFEVTFQVVLFKDGRLQMSYPSVPGTPGPGYLVGIAPDLSNPSLVTTVDFSRGPARTLSATPGFEPLVQIFGGATIGDPAIHLPAIARKVYALQPDAFDQLVIFTTFPQTAIAPGAGYSNNWRRAAAGVGDSVAFDTTSFVGSQGRLTNMVNMNALSLQPADPNAPINQGNTYTPMSFVGHEVGHAWMARARFNDGSACSDLILDDLDGHWSFYLDSGASVMNGVAWRDNGNGTFTTTEAVARYGPLDQYLMGLRDLSEVPDFFFIDNPSPGQCAPTALVPNGVRSCFPRVNVTVGGTRRNVSAVQVQACVGARLPFRGLSEVNNTNVWRQAWVLVVSAGTEPTADDLAKFDRFRIAFEGFFAQATGNRATLNTALVPPATLGMTPGSGNLNFIDTADFNVTLQNTGGVPLTGVVTASGPFSVTGGATVNVAAGGSQVVTVHFTAGGPGLAAGSLTLATNAGTVTRPLAAAAFTDPTLVARNTPVKLAHLLELRAVIDVLRQRRALPAFSWSDPSPVAGVTPVRRQHLLDLRTALGEAYAAAGLTPSVFSDPSPLPGVTTIKAAQMSELRTAAERLQ
jgi:hypothetical protein